ncbi:MAG: hypothetical protein AUH85_18435 [Chloroflexi bacterium 13_1_40CM_4_68_4]|nr:MAG: hypothetical protein AUH85_18435 [Chloroflexi bacterium 13_1_40CM_4_68_4]
MPESYGFKTKWVFEDATPEAVYEGLYRLVDYPRWWPQFTKVDVIDQDTSDMTVHSVLPYDLTYRLIRKVADPVGRRLEGRVDGDIRGTIRWEIGTDKKGRCVVHFRQSVSTRKWYMNLLAPIARPIFIWNHSKTMDHGRVGLQAFLAGYALAKKEPGAYKFV